MTKTLLLGTSVLAAMSLMGTAMAQSDEIIVTATKREQTLQEVPVAVSVVDGDVIEKAQIADVFDLQSVVPALRVSQLERAGNSTFIVRGFGNGGNNIGVEPSVAVYVDGVFRSRAPASLGDLPALERVEVLRGPQNTLFGKGASAGVVSLVTQEPQFERSGSVDATIGNYDLRKLRGYITGPLSENTAYSLAANVTQRDGYVDEVVSGETIGTRDRWGLRGQLLHEASDNVKIRFIGDYETADEICCYAPYFATGNTAALIKGLGGNVNVDPYGYKASLNFLPENEIENWGLSSHLDIAFDFGDLTYISAYRESYNFSNGDVDFSSAPLVSANHNNVNIDTFTQEIRLAGESADGRLNWLIGGFHLNESINSRSNLLFGDGFAQYANLLSGGATAALESALNIGAFFAPNTGTRESFLQTNQNYSIFGQADFNITDRLTATLGIGYVNDHKEVTATVTNTDLFSSLDLTSPAIAGAIGQIVLGGAFQAATKQAPTAANIAAFAAANPTQFAAIRAGAAAATPKAIKDLQGLQFLPGFIPLDDNNPVENRDTDDTDTTYTARLAYEVNDVVNIYGSYATGFKPSSWNLTRDSSPTAADFAILKQAAADNPTDYGAYAPNNRGAGTRYASPESITVWEAGLKANFDRGSVNLAIFDQTIEGFQSTIFSGTGFVLGNAGEQSAKGFEFDATFNVTEDFTLGASGVFLDPTYDSFPGAAVITGSKIDLADGVEDGRGDLTGEQPAGIHTTSLVFNATYVADLGNGTSGFFRADYQFDNEVPVVDNLPVSIFTREVSMFNASAGVEFEDGLEATLWGRNIFNDEHTQSGFPTTTQPGSFSGYPNMPATYGVTLRKNF